MSTPSKVDVDIKPADRGEAKVVTIHRPKYDKRFQLQSETEAYALWVAIDAEYGFSGIVRR
jgi:hypothetical protein